MRTVTLALIGIAFLAALPLSGSHAGTAAQSGRALAPRDLNDLEHGVEQIQKALKQVQARLNSGTLSVKLKEEKFGVERMADVTSALSALVASSERIEAAVAGKRFESDAARAQREAQAMLAAEVARAEMREIARFKPGRGEASTLAGEGRVLVHAVICNHGAATLTGEGDRWLLDVTSNVARGGTTGVTRYEGAQQFKVGLIVELPLTVTATRYTPEVQMLYTPIK